MWRDEWQCSGGAALAVLAVDLEQLGYRWLTWSLRHTARRAPAAPAQARREDIADRGNALVPKACHARERPVMGRKLELLERVDVVLVMQPPR